VIGRPLAVCTELARTMGARVTATTSSEKKAARILELGASDVININYVDTPGWGSEVRELADSQGTDVVVEVGGAGTIAQSITAVAHCGVISLVGHLEMTWICAMRRSLSMLVLWVCSGRAGVSRPTG
jgi:NADPH:quinone reductase-like Zn-dependent oxidoreductase